MTGRNIHSWFYEQDAEEGGTYAQVRGDSSTQAFRDVYRRCLAVFFASARAANPDAQLVLWLNRPWDPHASKVADETHQLLGRLGVQTRTVDYTYAPPEGAPSAWRNQFFVYDVLAAIADDTADDDLHLILDSDIVWAGGPRQGRMWEALAKSGALVYAIDYAAENQLNGFSRNDLATLAARLGHPAKTPPPYHGGEFIALRGDKVKALAGAAAPLWQRLLAMHRAGERIVTEEAHMLSLLDVMLELDGDAAPFVSRLWTQVGKYRNVGPECLELVLWHVPAEKRYGIPRLYRRMMRSGGVIWSAPRGEGWRAYTGRTIGLPRNTRSKIARDLGRAAAAKASPLRRP